MATFPRTYARDEPLALTCLVFQRMPFSQIFDYYAIEQWQTVIELCASSGAFADRREIVQIPLDTLLRWRWTRHIPYVVTDFPADRSLWPGYLEALKEQRTLGIKVPTTELIRADPAAEGLAQSLLPMEGTKRIVLGGERFRTQLFAAVENHEGKRTSIDALTPEGEVRIRTTGPDNADYFESTTYTVLNPAAYEMFAAVDLGLVDPARPPGPENPPLRDRLKMFYTYVTNSDLALFRTMAHLGNMAIARGEEGNWVWAAPFIARMNVSIGRRLYIPPAKLEKISAYLRRFGVYSMELARLIGLYRSIVPDFLSVGNMPSVAEVMGIEFPRPVPGEDLYISVADDEELANAVEVYTEEGEVYLVDGRRVSTEEI